MSTLLVVALAGGCAGGDVNPVASDAQLSAGDRADGDGESEGEGEGGSSSGGDVETTGDDGSGGALPPDRLPPEPGMSSGGGDPETPANDGGLGEQTLCEKLEYASCPTDDDSQLSHHEGLVPWASCRFELADQAIWQARSALLDELGGSLPELGVGLLAEDFDRLGTAVDASNPHLAKLESFDRGFRWQDNDFGDGAWMPQGLSGTYDAYEDGSIDGRELVAVSWYHNSDVSGLVNRKEIVRVSFADVTNIKGGAVPYRHVLLVEPFQDGGVVNFTAPKLHAGGIAWVGRYLYVADTAKGLRVFDTERILEVSPDKDTLGYDSQSGDYHAYGHKYVMPQVGAYYLSGSSCWVRSSYVAVDNTSDPPSLITGEFHGSDIAGKLVRWPLFGERLAATDVELGTTQASEIFFAQESDIQGALSIDGEWWLSSSAQSGADGRLYRTKERRPSVSYGWVVGPEDLMYSRQDGVLWGLNEFAGKRYVFAVDITSYPPLP